MTIAFRNVEGTTDDPVALWPYEGLVSVLANGGVRDWRPVLAEIRLQPWGPVARKVEHLMTYCEEPGLVNLFTLAIARARESREDREREIVAARVRAAVTGSGLAAREFASLVGTSASRLSTYMTGRTMPSAGMLLRIEAQASERGVSAQRSAPGTPRTRS